MSNWGKWLGYSAQPCPNCGRVRLELYENSKEVCEKCGWCPQDQTYVDRERMYEETEHTPDELKPCPSCGGEIRILVQIGRGAFAKCKICGKEYDICGMDKIPTYNAIHIRKSTVNKIRRWWTRRVGEGEKK